MEKLEYKIEEQISPLQVVKNFKSSFVNVDDVKATMHKIFQGFYTSKENDYLERAEREDISYHFNRVLELISEIENFSEERFMSFSDYESCKKYAAHLELVLNDKKELIELLKTKINILESGIEPENNEGKMKTAPRAEQSGAVN